MLTVLDLFSGIGGFSLGLERTGGFQTIAFCEQDTYCQRVLAKHWPEVPIHDDVRTIPKIDADVICGGFPCQPFSSASRGRANATDLWPDMRKQIGKIRPKWVLAENVPGIGLDGVDRICADLEVEGYTVWPLNLDTSPPGRSRGRVRIFWMAYTDSDREPHGTIYAETSSVPTISGCRAADAGAVGMDDGLWRRVDRLRALGNAVVPQVVEILGRAILKMELLH